MSGPFHENDKAMQANTSNFIESKTICSTHNNSYNLTNSRKQSMPVQTIAFLNKNLDWKIGRKQSENIVFKSTDLGVKPKSHLENLNMKNVISKSEVFTSHINSVPVQKNPTEKNNHKIEYSITFGSKRTTFYESEENEIQTIYGKQGERVRFLGSFSNERDRLSSIDNPKITQIGCQSMQFFPNNQGVNMQNANDFSHESNSKQIQNRSQAFIREAMTPDCSKKRDHESVFSDRKNFKFRESLKIQNGALGPVSEDEKSYPTQNSINELNIYLASKESKQWVPKNLDFSLAMQNQSIQKEIQDVDPNSTFPQLPRSFEVKTLNLDRQVTIKNGTLKEEQVNSIEYTYPKPQVNRPDNMYINIKPESCQPQTTNSYLDLMKSQSNNAQAIDDYETKKDVKKNKMHKDILNLNCLVDTVNKSVPTQFSKLDINLIRTLSKSFNRSNPLLITKSRYDFAQQSKSLKLSDLHCGQEDLQRTQTKQDILSIFKLIKTFLAAYK